MFTPEQELTLPQTKVNSPYDTDVPSSEASSLEDSSSNSVASAELDHRSSITLEDASKALINASHSLSNAAHEYTIAIEQDIDIDGGVPDMSQLRQRSLNDYSCGVQDIAHHVTYLSAYMQQNFSQLRAGRETVGMETRPTNEDSKRGEEAGVKMGNATHVDTSGDVLDRHRFGPDGQRIYGWHPDLTTTILIAVRRCKLALTSVAYEPFSSNGRSISVGRSGGRPAVEHII